MIRALVAHVAILLALAATPTLAQTIHDVRPLIEAALPKSGSVIAEYDSIEPNVTTRVRVGYDAATRAWFFIANDTAWLQDAQGRQWESTVGTGLYKPVEPTSPWLSSLIDWFIPDERVRALWERPDRVTNVQRRTDGGVVVVAEYIGGSRDLPLREDLLKHNPMAAVTFSFSPTGQLESLVVGAHGVMPAQPQYYASDKAPSGWIVSERYSDSVPLTRLRYHPDGAPGLFSKEYTIEVADTLVREASRQIVFRDATAAGSPVPGAPKVPPASVPTPPPLIADRGAAPAAAPAPSAPAWRTPVLIASILLIVIALAAKFARRAP